MRSIVVFGSRTFNNYYLLHHVLDSHLEKGDVIVEGEAAGVDCMAGLYGKLHGYRTLQYPADWEQYGPGAGYVRNNQMASVVDCGICIISGYAASKGSEHMLQTLQERNIPVSVYRFKKDDLLQFSPTVVHCMASNFNAYIGRRAGKFSASPLANPYPVVGTSFKNRLLSISHFIDDFIDSDMLQAEAERIRGKILGCWCGPGKLCHGNFIQWWWDHAACRL